MILHRSDLYCSVFIVLILFKITWLVSGQDPRLYSFMGLYGFMVFKAAERISLIESLFLFSNYSFFV